MSQSAVKTELDETVRKDSQVNAIIIGFEPTGVDIYLWILFSKVLNL